MTPGVDGDPALAAAISWARASLRDLHAALVDNGLVAWTSGNVSARVRAAGPAVQGTPVI